LFALRLTAFRKAIKHHSFYKIGKSGKRNVPERSANEEEVRAHRYLTIVLLAVRYS